MKSKYSRNENAYNIFIIKTKTIWKNMGRDYVDLPVISNRQIEKIADECCLEKRRIGY